MFSFLRSSCAFPGAVGIAFSVVAVASSHCRRQRCLAMAFLSYTSRSRMINLDGILHNDLCRTHRGSLAARRKPSGPSKSLAITGALVGKARRDTILTEEGHYRVHQDIQDGSKMRFVSRVMYDGTNYNGFQLQQNGQPTIQGVLETTLSRRFQTYIPVVAAGRTDTGVHAMGQAVHFDLPKTDVDLGQLTYVMNQMMPEDIRMYNMSQAPRATPEQEKQGLPWHVMLNARGKVYRYRLFVGDIPSPLNRLYRVHAAKAARAPINVDLLYETLPLFVGKHDFAGYSNQADKRAAQKLASGAGEFNTWRELYHAEIVDEGGGNISIDFHLDGALYRMVRNIVGTMLSVAAGRIGVETIEEIFETGARDSSKVYAAPPNGLTLQTVHYDEY